jgi:hypothetical protein
MKIYSFTQNINMITILKTHYEDSTVKWSTASSKEKLRLSIEYNPWTFCSKCIAGESCPLCLPGYTIRWYKGNRKVEVSGQVAPPGPDGITKKAKRVISNVTDLSNFWDKENLPKDELETRRVILEVRALLEETGLRKHDSDGKAWYEVKE